MIWGVLVGVAAIIAVAVALVVGFIVLCVFAEGFSK